jgi:ribonuclease VapC
MIVDSSAIVAILNDEPEARPFVAAISAANEAVMSAGNYLEAGIVVDRSRDWVVSARLDALLAELDIEIAPVTASQAKAARQAYRDYGKHGKHPAQLNYGDCFAYALAMERGEALLYKGEDFAHAGLARVV